jgi:hypothetical protein
MRLSELTDRSTEAWAGGDGTVRFTADGKPTVEAGTVITNIKADLSHKQTRINVSTVLPFDLECLKKRKVIRPFKIVGEPDSLVVCVFPGAFCGVDIEKGEKGGKMKFMGAITYLKRANQPVTDDNAQQSIARLVALAIAPQDRSVLELVEAKYPYPDQFTTDFEVTHVN